MRKKHASLWVPAALALALLTAQKPARPTPATTAQRPEIMRVWRGRTLDAKADEYQRYLIASGIVRIRATPGNLGYSVLRRSEGGRTEFLVISRWESLEAVKRFAGADYEKAVILERDREYLIDVEEKVMHYERVAEQIAGK